MFLADNPELAVWYNMSASSERRVFENDNNRRMANWYSADPHFGHDNIIKLCGRPFGSIAEMDAVIRANYANCIGPDDDFWIVGDLSFGRTSSQKGYLEKLFASLPGRIPYAIALPRAGEGRAAGGRRGEGRT